MLFSFSMKTRTGDIKTCELNVAGERKVLRRLNSTKVPFDVPSLWQESIYLLPRVYSLNKPFDEFRLSSSMTAFYSNFINLFRTGYTTGMCFIRIIVRFSTLSCSFNSKAVGLQWNEQFRSGMKAKTFIFLHKFRDSLGQWRAINSTQLPCHSQGEKRKQSRESTFGWDFRKNHIKTSELFINWVRFCAKSHVHVKHIFFIFANELK